MSDTSPEPEPVEHEHGEYDSDVPDVDLLEPDFDAEDTDEVDEVDDEDGGV